MALPRDSASVEGDTWWPKAGVTPPGGVGGGRSEASAGPFPQTAMLMAGPAVLGHPSHVVSVRET